MSNAQGTGPLGIIAGAGVLPLRVAEAARRAGRSVFVAALDGWADPAVAAWPHERVGIGAIGRIIRLLREHGCEEIVFVGALVRPDLKRPDLRALKVDFGALKHLPALVGMTGRGGDDRLLGRVIRLFEREGFRVVGAHDVAPDLLAPEGLIAGPQPGFRARGAITMGLEAARALGRLDIGQAVAVVAGRVVAVEAAEGTDLMLERVAALRASGRLRIRGRDGVLIKVPKPGQDLRVDMPAIGERTIVNAAAAGLCGVAVETGGVLIADRPALAAAASKSGVFVFGVAADERR